MKPFDQEEEEAQKIPKKKKKLPKKKESKGIWIQSKKRIFLKFYSLKVEIKG
jgi:hypothetical protein